MPVIVCVPAPSFTTSPPSIVPANVADDPSVRIVSVPDSSVTVPVPESGPIAIALLAYDCTSVAPDERTTGVLLGKADPERIVSVPPAIVVAPA
ncbi:MAG: hypothetical protein WCC69_09845 [Pirellulales bacterium]